MTKTLTAILPSPATANALSLTSGHQLFLKAKLQKCGALPWQKGHLQARALLPEKDEDIGICPGVTESAWAPSLLYRQTLSLYLAAGSRGAGECSMAEVTHKQTDRQTTTRLKQVV